MDAPAPPDTPSEPKRVRLSVFGQVYNLSTTGDPAELEESARRVDELMCSIARGGNLDAGRIAVLAAMHLADQMRIAEQRSLRLQSLLRQLDEAVEA
ncbi:MAG: cell division protein ZapA [Acidobacteria bacterium]|nr:cell division protein ZapA [Acidobacteriota bacterium]